MKGTKPWYQQRCEESGELYRTFEGDRYMTEAERHISYNKNITQRLRDFMFRRLLINGLFWVYQTDPKYWRGCFGTTTN